MLQKGFDQVANINCRWRYRRLLSAYLDNELDTHAAAPIANHLRECTGCRVELEQLRFANRALIEFEIPPMRTPLMVGQVFRLPASKEVSPLRRVFSQKIAVPLPLAAGLVIALVGAVLFAIGSNQRTPNRSTVSHPATPSAVIKVVEVPVDRVVTRTVFLKQTVSGRVRGVPKGTQFTPTPSGSKGDLAQNSGKIAEWSDSTLKDFRPAASANLRVVKEQEK